MSSRLNFLTSRTPRRRMLAISAAGTVLLAACGGAASLPVNSADALSAAGENTLAAGFSWTLTVETDITPDLDPHIAQVLVAARGFEMEGVSRPDGSADMLARYGVDLFEMRSSTTEAHVRVPAMAAFGGMGVAPQALVDEMATFIDADLPKRQEALDVVAGMFTGGWVGILGADALVDTEMQQLAVTDPRQAVIDAALERYRDEPEMAGFWDEDEFAAIIGGLYDDFSAPDAFLGRFGQVTETATVDEGRAFDISLRPRAMFERFEPLVGPISRTPDLPSFNEMSAYMPESLSGFHATAEGTYLTSMTLDLGELLSGLDLPDEVPDVDVRVVLELDDIGTPPAFSAPASATTFDVGSLTEAEIGQWETFLAEMQAMSEARGAAIG